MASTYFPLVKAWTKRCIPHAGHDKPVSNFKGHLGQKPYATGLNLYSTITAAMVAVIHSIRFFN